jgi:hypothetical protein
MKCLPMMHDDIIFYWHRFFLFCLVVWGVMEEGGEKGGEKGGGGLA